MSKRLTKLAVALAAGLALNTAAPIAFPSFAGLTTAAQAGQLDEFRTVLSRYGSYQSHERYGEIWVPASTTVPQGWHPYAPCNWVHHKELGWYYDDRTEWGQIVHHYGRWTHDATLGWVWVGGEEFSPGWVVWRTSEQWVGWAPMPPEQDIKTISAEQFNTDKHWIFMDAKKFGNKCQGGDGIAHVSQYPVIMEHTHFVTEIRFVRGIVIFVLPPPLIINIVDIDIGIFNPWSPCFFGAWFWNWNWVVNNINVVVNFPPAPVQCNMPQQKLITPILSNPPPPPGGKPPINPGNPPRNTDTPPSKPERKAGNESGSNGYPGTFPRIPPVVFPNFPGRPDSGPRGDGPTGGKPGNGDTRPPKTDTGSRGDGPNGKWPGRPPVGSGNSGSTNNGGGKVGNSGTTRPPLGKVSTFPRTERVISSNSGSARAVNIMQRPLTRTNLR